MGISYLKYKDINKNKWDDCIQHAVNGLIYARTFYLDSMADNWDALVLNDYEAVMPLTFKVKWGIKYLYQPAFIQQCGIYFLKPLSREEIIAFINEAVCHFKFAEVTLNYSNDILLQHAGVQVEQRINFVLNLDNDYDKLYHNYDPSFTKSLRRIKKFSMKYVSTDEYETTIKLYQDLYAKRLPFFEKKSYGRFQSICKKLAGERNVIVRQAHDHANNLLASVILLKDDNRLYNMISCITEGGKRIEANYFLYDCILREFSNTNRLLDFEGSDVEGIAAFYKKFNPEMQAYPFIRYNKLPLFIRMFKR